jgi:hypothetical protein
MWIKVWEGEMCEIDLLFQLKRLPDNVPIMLLSKYSMPTIFPLLFLEQLYRFTSCWNSYRFWSVSAQTVGMGRVNIYFDPGHSKLSLTTYYGMKYMKMLFLTIEKRFRRCVYPLNWIRSLFNIYLFLKNPS